MAEDRRIVLVTGAAGGLGRAFSLAFAARGDAVVAADLDTTGAEETARLVRPEGGEAIAKRVDVSSEESVEAMVDPRDGGARRRRRPRQQRGALRAVSSAGRSTSSTRTIWDRVMAVNLKGPWLCARACVPSMRERGGGAIVNVASATVLSGSTLFAHYVASKGGLIALTRAMAREVGDLGITVNAVAPGFTLTEASLGLIDDAESYGVSRGAIKRSSHPEDVVGTVLFLASQASALRHRPDDRRRRRPPVSLNICQVLTSARRSVGRSGGTLFHFIRVT